MYRLRLLVILLIVHGSLYPWHFQSPPFPTNPLVVFLHSWPAQVSRYLLRDIAVNLALYLPLGLFGYWALRPPARKVFAGTATLLLALLLSVGMETAQLFVPSRTCSLFDVMLNVAGAALGVGLAVAFEDRPRAMTSVAGPALAPAASGAMVLLACWVGYQLFPFFPDLSRTHLAEKLRPLASPDSWWSGAAFVSFVEWAVVGRLLVSLTHPERFRTTFVFLLLLLPVRLVLAGRSMMGAELAGGVLAFALWRGLGAAAHSRTRFLPWLLALTLAIDGLAPFHFQTAGAPFRWLPFQGVLDSDWQAGLAVLLRKSFVYGAAVWLLRQSGWRFASAGILTSVCLAGIEAAQVHLPGRTSEIADPLLALIMTFILVILSGPPSAAGHERVLKRT